MSQKLQSSAPYQWRPVTHQGQNILELWEDLSEELGRRLGPAGADLLARPVMGVNGHTDWYGNIGPDQSPEALREQFETLKTVLFDSSGSYNGELTGFMKAALEIPDPSCLHSGPHGPVLVGWGCRNVGRLLQPDDITAKLSALAPHRDIPPKKEGAEESSPKEAARPQAASVENLPPEKPVPTPSAELPQPVSKTSSEVQSRTSQSEIPLDTAKKVILEKPSLFSRWQLWKNSRKDRKQAAAVKASTGRMQIILTWNDLNDLDLHVICPSGERIYFHTPRAGGGILDRDANARTQGRPPPVINPVENIYWPQNPPPGRYYVCVDPFDMWNRPQSRYRLTLVINGKTAACEYGVVRAGQYCLPAMTFSIP